MDAWGQTLNLHVVVPAYRVETHIIDVLRRIGPEVSKVWVVDDACPHESGQLVLTTISDPRVKVIIHESNAGVGGATITGYRAAIQDNADVIVKLDGDGQMFPEDIPKLISPLITKEADYTKGNRFDSLQDLRKMPKLRILGNAVLSLMSKTSTGYWSVNDPTNGFTAIHRSALERIDLEKLSKRFFFESDMLFRLNLAGAVVRDVALPARYGDERSNLKIRKVLMEFPLKHARNHLKRIGYRYYLREWSIGSIELVFGLLLAFTGTVFGITTVLGALARGESATAGQVTFASLTIILGFQLILSFISYDIQSEPKTPLQKR